MLAQTLTATQRFVQNTDNFLPEKRCASAIDYILLRDQTLKSVMRLSVLCANVKNQRDHDSCTTGADGWVALDAAHKVQNWLKLVRNFDQKPQSSAPIVTGALSSAQGDSAAVEATSAPGTRGNIILSLLADRSKDFFHRQVEQNVVFVPFIQNGIDVNDTWFVCGATIGLLVLMLSLSMQREYEVLHIARGLASSNVRKYLLISSQYISVPSQNSFRRYIYFTPFLISSYKLLDLYETYPIASDLEGAGAMWTLWFFHISSTLFLLYSTIRAFNVADSFDNLLFDIKENAAHIGHSANSRSLLGVLRARPNIRQAATDSSSSSSQDISGKPWWTQPPE